MKISIKLSSIFVINIILIIIIGIVFFKSFKSNDIRHIIDKSEYVQKTFSDLKKSDIKMLSAGLEVFTQDDTFKKTFLERDREKLYSQSKPLFEKLKKQFGITHFYYILPDGHCFLRVHNRNIYGDLITRTTFENAEKTKQIASGLELGKTAFALRAVMPYYYDGKLIGYVEFGEEIDHLLDVLKSTINENTVLVVVEKKYLDRKNFISVKQIAGLRDNWNDLKDYVIINNSATDEVLESRITRDNIKEVRNGNKFLNEIKLSDKVYSLSGFQIIGASGKQIGIIFTLQNITKSAAVSEKLYLWLLIILIIAVVIAVLSLIYIFRSIAIPVKKITNALAMLALGKRSEKINIKSKNEIGSLVESFNKLYEIQNNISLAAGKVAKGNTLMKLREQSDDDVLSISFNKMVAKLNEQENTNNDRNWTSDLFENINSVLRKEKDISILSNTVCSILAKALDIQIAALYLFDGNNLILKGSYAFNKRKKIAAQIDVGEGLLGQAVIEKEMISFTDIPHDYLRIKYAHGNKSPVNIVILPFIVNDEVFGVLELGSLVELSDLKLEFLKLISEPIAISFSSLKQQSQLKKLLEQTQEQSRNLQAQQEELKCSNEELENQTEELKIAGERLQSQQEELKVSNEELEEKSEKLENQKKGIEKNNEILKRIGEELKVKSEQLEISSKYKSEFLANMSHELRTPLNSLLILSKNFTKNREGNLTDKQISNAEIIYGSSCDLLNIINDILDLSKIEAGKMEVLLSELELSDFKKKIHDSFNHVMKNKNLEFSIELDSSLPEKIVTDSQKLEQILKNLLSNAVKFTEHGSIKVRIFRPHRTEDFANAGVLLDNAIAISVTDTGIGISEEKQKLIFEAFQQADGTTSRKFGGTGLGLSISREMARLIDGKIILKSHEGAGSVFTLIFRDNFDRSSIEEEKLNCVDTEKSKICSADETDNSRIIYQTIKDDMDLIEEGDKVILVIDNDLNFSQILYDKCKEKGYNCIHAADGYNGFILAEKYQPVGILLDIKLPEIDGMEVLAKLKNSEITKNIPVHMMSANDKTLSSLKDGAVGFLKKPVSSESLEIAFIKLICPNDDVSNVLIIEDDIDLCEIVKDVLEMRSLSVDMAHNGKNGIKKLKENKFELVILDLSLPDISGFKLLEQIKEIDENINVIIFTGKYLSEKENNLIRKYSASTVLKNSVSMDRLLDEVSLFLHTNEVNNIKDTQSHSEHLSDSNILKDRTVLIVDDDMRNIYLLEDEFSYLNMNVRKAMNGRMAIEELKKNDNIDMVLMDIMMPVMDGIEAIREIRKIPKFSCLPIIALTAKAMKEDRDKCIDAGADDYLTKPVDMDKLMSLIRVWIKK